MFQDNPLLNQLKQTMQENTPKRTGIVKASERGFGFLETDKGKRFFIAPADMKKVLHGDKISASIQENGDKSTATPVELKHTEIKEFVAQLSISGKRISVKANNPLLQGFFKIKGAMQLADKGYHDGDWVKVKLLEHALKGNGFLTEIVEKIAEHNDPFAYRLIAVATHQLPSKAPEFDHPWQVIDEELERRDLTKTPFFTIDGVNTQDMDDALYIEENDQGWALTVAISDPSAYVPEKTDMDKEAKKRSFTLYLPNFNVPMLPRDLSDSLCSLKEGEKRATICCTMQIGKNGEIVGEPEFFAAYIKSHYRLNYHDVSTYLENEELTDNQWKPNKQLGELLRVMEQASLVRHQWRCDNTIVMKSQHDYTLKLNNKGEVYEILCEPRRTANRLVEESMIAANVCAGDFLAKHTNKGVFNVHSGFASDRLEKAVTLLAEYGVTADKESLATLEGYIKMRQEVALLHNTYLDHRLRRLLAYADTSASPAPHFTMGVSHYATWTSPIRKYGDLINHRLIKSVLMQKESTKVDPEIGAHLNEARKSQRMAERDVNNLLYCRYLKDQENSDWRYKAEIFDIVKAGCRVRVQENGATFFVPSSMLGKTNKNAKDEEVKKIECIREQGVVKVGEQIELQLGDVIDVMLTSVKPESRQLIAKLADPLG
ncbi:exoribonuclease II [Psychromonas algicola]|uniref:exoribonuclease II n=1 Tax=Psychromonas algicola TaxID=2555642 RepID=UPI0010672AA5|nr:exoribonuclease II [Psychromonas sp. RZ5]TEW44861.1 exoribonuclease II [Psychromonas sp. RZ5]